MIGYLKGSEFSTQACLPNNTKYFLKVLLMVVSASVLAKFYGQRISNSKDIFKNALFLNFYVC